MCIWRLGRDFLAPCIIPDLLDGTACITLFKYLYCIAELRRHSFGVDNLGLGIF